MSAETFHITPHHLVEYCRFIEEYFEGDIEKFVSYYAKASVFEIKTAPDLNYSNYLGIRHSYRTDTLGKNDENESKFVEAIINQTRKILSLPDETAVNLSFSKDEVCNSCAFGKHCDLPREGYDKDIVALEGLVIWHEFKGVPFTRSEDGSLNTTIGALRMFLRVPDKQS